MRINVYTEELTNDIQIVEKNGFHGLRFFLESAETLHNTPEDDDRSAITFWGLRKTKEVIERAAKLINSHQPKEPG